MPLHYLGPKARQAVEDLIDALFDRAKVRTLGPQAIDKRIVLSWSRDLSIPGLFEAAAKEEGFLPNLDALNSLLDVAGGYIDSTRERVKARVLNDIQTTLREASLGGIETDLKTALQGQMSEVWRDATTAMRTIVDVEAQNAKNVSLMDGIVKVNVVQGVEDPVIFFVTARDDKVCDECRRIHLLPDGITPRVWRLSEVKHGYHKRGEDSPAIGDLHPNGRCTLVTLLPGFGFNDAGLVTFVNPRHDEFARQRGTAS